MVLLGWAAINEGGRMLALEDTYHARAIEQGAALFASQCTRCHGPDGRGLAGYAPGLNNPQFFGHDFYPETTSQINALDAESVALEAERNARDTTDERKAEIDTRLEEIDTEILTLTADRNPQVQAAVDLGYDPQQPNRLQNLGWVGTRDAFILTTLIHGRPVSINYWREAMPAWSQTAGGPLRMDQLEDLVAYVQNWDKGDQWTIDDLLAVKQFAIEPVQGVPGEEIETVGTDVEGILVALADVEGNADRGNQLYHNQAVAEGGTRLACSGCHIQTSNGTGPMADGTFTRVETVRLQDPLFEGYTPEQYIVESILQPGAYVAPGFQNLMPADFGARLTLQDLADLLAYIETLNQPAS
jgi:mono/diheme cytochrome c family protein